MPSTKSAALLSSSQVARRLDVSTERVRRWAEDGRLPATKTVLGRLFDVADVDALARERAQRQGARASTDA